MPYTLSELLQENLLIDDSNVIEILHAGLLHHSSDILLKCFQFIKTKANLEITCDDSHPPIFISIQELSGDERIKETGELIDALKAGLQEHDVRIKIMLSSNNMTDTMKQFIDKNRASIYDLYLNEFESNSLEDVLQDLPNLKYLHFISCDLKGDETVFENLKNFNRLQSLNFYFCNQMEQFPNIQGSSSLQQLLFRECSINNVENIVFPSLKTLIFTDCARLEGPLDLQGFIGLETLNISNCSLKEPPVLQGLSVLKSLLLSHSKFTTPPNLQGLTALETVDLSYCFINEPPVLDELLSLKTLNLSHTLIEVLPEFSHCNDLQSLNLAGCMRINPQKQIASIQKLYQDNPKLLTRLFHFFTNMEHRYCIDFSGITANLEKSLELSEDSTQQALDEALHLSILYNQTELAAKAIALGANINNQYVPGSSPLIEACLFKCPLIVKLLLENGAEVKIIKNGNTPLSIALSQGEPMEECAHLLAEKDDGFTDEIIRIKKLAHKFSIGGKSSVDGKEFRREGFSWSVFIDDYVDKSRYFYDSLIHDIVQGHGTILDSFSDQAKVHLQTILEDENKREQFIKILNLTYSAMQTPIDLEASKEAIAAEILEKLTLGKPVVCLKMTNSTSVWHIWGLVITKEAGSERYCVHRCNRGYGVNQREGILIGVLDKEEMLRVVHSFQKYSDWKFKSKRQGDRFFGTLDDKLRNTPNSRLIKQTKQTLGNCAYYSLQSIDLSLLQAQMPSVIDDTDGSVALSREIKRIRSSYMRLNDLNKYLNAHLTEKTPSRLPDWELIQEILEKAEKKHKLYPFREAICNFIEQIISSAPDALKDSIPPKLR